MYVSMKEMLNKAHKGKYAVMAINCFNLETARSVIKSAEAENAPIIVNIFHDHMLGHCDSSVIAPLVKVLAEQSSVEVALNYDHGMSKDLVLKAIDDGYSSVMIDMSQLDFEDNVRITKEVVEYAHARNVSVEAEVGCMGGSEGGNYTSELEMTDPQEAEDFVKATGIDCLAVSFGTSHGDYPKGHIPELDFRRLEEIKRRTQIPLVLHGGSGAGEKNMRRCVELGINKINVGNDFMKANRDSLIKTALKTPDVDFLTFIQNAEKESQDVVRKYIRIAKSNNKSQGEII